MTIKLLEKRQPLARGSLEDIKTFVEHIEAKDVVSYGIVSIHRDGTTHTCYAVGDSGRTGALLGGVAYLQERLLSGWEDA